MTDSKVNLSEQLRKVLQYQLGELREVRKDRRELERKITQKRADEIALLVAIDGTREMLRNLDGEEDGFDITD